jgi:serine/threonine protein kinase
MGFSDRFSEEDTLMRCVMCKSMSNSSGIVSFCVYCHAPIEFYGWHVEELLGSGAAGYVYRVTKEDEQAALKIVTDRSLNRMREDRNLLAAADLGITPRPIIIAPEGILMEYFPSSVPLSVNERIALFLGAVNKLHNRGIVHCDLKPDNIVSYGWQLLDMGAAVLPSDLAPSPYGTPGYAPREAYQGIISPLWDAYSAGWVIWQWLGGPPPRDPPPIDHSAIPAGYVWMLDGLMADQYEKRLTVGQAYASLCPSWIRLSNSTLIGRDLVTTGELRAVVPTASCRSVYDYAVAIDPDDVQRFCKAGRFRLPTTAELQELAVGTEHQVILRDYEIYMRRGLVSDRGARFCRRFLAQPTLAMTIFGGSIQGGQDIDAAPKGANPLVGLRVVKL